MKIIQILFFSIFLMNCNKESNSIILLKNNLTINIQPFEDFSLNDSKYIQNKILEIYPYVRISEKIKFPRNSYVLDKNRYRADSLIRFLHGRNKKNEVIIGLTNYDISTSVNNVNDWGVIGLGFCPGTSSVASTHRLSKNKKLDQLFKIAIHELGHTQGLKHCKNIKCLMQDAKGKNPADKQYDFCSDCKEKLIEKGWF